MMPFVLSETLGKMGAAVHAIGIYNAEPFTPEAKMRGITGFSTTDVSRIT